MNVQTLAKKAYYKLKIDIVWNVLASEITRMFWKPLHIMTAKETVDYILQEKCSVARFGDGELQIAAYGCGLKFQRADKKLQKKLTQVMASKNKKLLLCLPNRINMVTRKERATLTPYWQKSLRKHLYPWTKNLNKARLYGDTNLSRLTEGKNREAAIKQVLHIREIWTARNIIIVEGEKTRFGVGNNLLENAGSISRVLGPAESAFDYYDQLFIECCNLAKTLRAPLVLLALGPTATVLASDLADSGIQAIDIGHLDIGYERLLTGNTGAIPGKYTNEAEGGNIVADCLDEKYLSEIATRIGID